MPASKMYASSQDISSSFATEQCKQTIEEVAYYRVENRGFQCGGLLRDWLEAEAEIERIMSGKRH
jgi:hypothetical protein